MTQEPSIQHDGVVQGRTKRASRSPSAREGGKDAQNPSKVNGVNVREPQVPKKKRADQSYRCGGCDAVWGGLLTAHCAGCHQTFSRESTFNLHRPIAGRGRTGTSKCHDPESVGLVQNSREYSCWGMPTPEDSGFWASDDE
ncbi:hypothetical protein SEA_JONJAMES_120 [Gordonia Phage JonJames]|nr:hypothetical protein SEA_JONJAMES_120 [Gordonia Phage JonJames]